MDIASPEEGDTHVISVRKFKNLQDAIKKAVYLKIGMSIRSICYLVFILTLAPASISFVTSSGSKHSCKLYL